MGVSEMIVSEIPYKQYKCSGCSLFNIDNGNACNKCYHNNIKKIEYMNYKRRIILNDKK